MTANKITNRDRKFRPSTFAYSYADSAARTGARGFADADVGKVAIQEDTEVRYLLTSQSSGVPTWEAAPDIDDLASTATGKGDSLVGHYDASARWTATTVWGIIEELMDRIVATGSTSLSKIMGIEDSGSKITATTVDGAVVENRTALDVAEADVATNAADIAALRPGVPMINRLQLLGAPGAIVEADYLTIGADVYEFRSDTPPSGGTAGRIWVRTVTDSATCRANLIDAINGVVDAARITYDGAVTEEMLGVAGESLGDIMVVSADAIGGNPAPSVTATVCTENLTTATDIWDQGTMLSGVAVGATSWEVAKIVITAAMIAKGDVQAYFSFTPTRAILLNRSRAQDEAYAISGDTVSLTLTGGASPNNQAADIVDVWAFE